MIEYVVAGREFIRVAESWTRFIFDGRLYRRNILGEWCVAGVVKEVRR